MHECKNCHRGSLVFTFLCGCGAVNSGVREPTAPCKKCQATEDRELMEVDCDSCHLNIDATTWQEGL